MPAATKPARRASARASLPLPALLSQVVVAFIIEFDNEFEHQMPNRTTNSPSGRRFGPWLTSMVMWSTCLRFVGEQGVTVRELERLARTTTNLNGMERWRYITVRPDPADTRPKPPKADWLIQATPAGRLAQEVWRSLFGTIEKRWQERFGNAPIEQLRKSLATLVRQFTIALPDCLPILHYGLFSKILDREPAHRDDADLSALPLPALVSKVLLAFALDFERDADPGGVLDLSLAICANVLRVLDDEGIRVRDLPRLSGVSKEAIAMALGYLEKRQYIVTESDPASRAKLVRLTDKGLMAHHAYPQRVAAIEGQWQERYGEANIRNLRESLKPLIGAQLFRGLEPYPDGWRASVPRPETLPHYPMVLHRGGYPDGS
jgi:DNA-binding MarR family transcriptional regulator